MTIRDLFDDRSVFQTTKNTNEHKLSPLVFFYFKTFIVLIDKEIQYNSLRSPRILPPLHHLKPGGQMLN